MKTVLVFSGGMDSTVLLFQLLSEGYEVAKLSVNYGQKHAKELDRAAAISHSLGLLHETADLTGITGLFGRSSLTDGNVEVPLGHYEEDNMKSTVVPNRNMILLSLATAWAASIKAESISYAAHSGDHAIYPDCREEFAEAMDKAIRLADWQKIFLNRPFVNFTTADIVLRGNELKVPFEKTWSCYDGGELHCGRCGTCIERREAFHLAGIEDSTIYADEAPTVDVMIANEWRI